MANGKPATTPPPKDDEEFSFIPGEKEAAIIKDAERTALPLVAPTTNFVRTVRGIDPKILRQSPEDQRTLLTNLDPNLLDPNYRTSVVFNKLVYLGKAGGKFATYTGTALVNENAELVRPKYGDEDSQIIDEANTALINLNVNPRKRLELLQELKRVGFYGNDEISSITLSGSGFTADDTQAMARYLVFSQNNFKTWEATFPSLALLPTASAGSSGRRFTPYSDADMGSYLRELSLALTGEVPSKAKLKKMLQESIAMQRQAFAAGTDSPSISTVAQSVVSEANPQQQTAYGLGNAISRAFAVLGRG